MSVWRARLGYMCACQDSHLAIRRLAGVSSLLQCGSLGWTGVARHGTKSFHNGDISLAPFQGGVSESEVPATGRSEKSLLQEHQASIQKPKNEEGAADLAAASCTLQ